MTAQQILALMPMLVLSGTAVVLMLQASIKRNPLAAWCISALGLLAALWGVGYAAQFAGQVTPLLVVDHWSQLFTTLLVISAAVVLVVSRTQVLDGNSHGEEFYLLLILATLGAVVLVSATHVASLLLGMELLGISLYTLIAFPERNNLAIEASVKYLVLSACGSAMLLFGFGLLYAAGGTLEFSAMGNKLADAWQSSAMIVLAGSALVLAGLAFKLSLVPFHMWTPDVYQGAPTSVTAFLATVSKGAMFVVMSRFLVEGGWLDHGAVLNLLSVLAAASMLLGNWLALRQDNIKRLLAYSSIAHMGYLLVVLVASGVAKLSIGPVITFYLAAYMVTSLVALAVAEMISGAADEHYELTYYSGLFWRDPLKAAALSLAMLSLAGIPLTAGFIGKFYVISIGVQSSRWALLFVLLIGSALSIYYYLRVIFAMSKPADEGAAGASSGSGEIALLLMLMLAVLWLGSWPQPFLDLITQN